MEHNRHMKDLPSCAHPKTKTDPFSMDNKTYFTDYINEAGYIFQFMCQNYFWFWIKCFDDAIQFEKWRIKKV